MFDQVIFSDNEIKGEILYKENKKFENFIFKLLKIN